MGLLPTARGIAPRAVDSAISVEDLREARGLIPEMCLAVGGVDAGVRSSAPLLLPTAPAVQLAVPLGRTIASLFHVRCM
jgi:hypothetical protein